MKKDSDRNKGFAFVIYEKAKDVDNLMSHRYVFYGTSVLLNKQIDRIIDFKVLFLPLIVSIPNLIPLLYTIFSFS